MSEPDWREMVSDEAMPAAFHPAETFCGTCGPLDYPGAHPFPECPRYVTDEWCCAGCQRVSAAGLGD